MELYCPQLEHPCEEGIPNWFPEFQLQMLLGIIVDHTWGVAVLDSTHDNRADHKAAAEEVYKYNLAPAASTCIAVNEEAFHRNADTEKGHLSQRAHIAKTLRLNLDGS